MDALQGIEHRLTILTRAEKVQALPLSPNYSQPEKSTRAGPCGGQMILNITVFQDHHEPKASVSDGLGSL